MTVHFLFPLADRVQPFPKHSWGAYPGTSSLHDGISNFCLPCTGRLPEAQSSLLGLALFLACFVGSGPTHLKCWQMPSEEKDMQNNNSSLWFPLLQVLGSLGFGSVLNCTFCFTPQPCKTAPHTELLLSACALDPSTSQHIPRAGRWQGISVSRPLISFLSRILAPQALAALVALQCLPSSVPILPTFYCPR